MKSRWLAPTLGRALAKSYVQILFGARQTGKSTLLRSLLPETDLWIDLSEPEQRSRYLARPGTFVEICEGLPRGRGARRVVVDEAQAVPAIFDGVQHLFDRDKERFRFVLTGSSARKLRASGANLLPGRSMLHRLYPLALPERPATEQKTPFEPLLPLPAMPTGPKFPAADLLERLAFGELPGIALAAEKDREPLLRSYAYVYLEEELRREALIKDWSTFARFLRLAALEAGATVNFSKIARQAGLSLPTVKSHYQLLEDMFVGFPVEAFSGSPRQHLLSTPRFLFFDVGVRHAAAGLANNRDTVLADPGRVFEQWVGIELWKRVQYLGQGRLTYFRTASGSEVDFVVEIGQRLLPIEVKWTDAPDLTDVRHLRAFVDGHRRRAPMGYIVCRCDRPRRLADDVTALPWWAL